MGFPQKIADEVLVRCSRHCCLCGVYAGSKIELHHIKQVADGGDDSAENCIPLCLNCHAEVKAYVACVELIDVIEKTMSGLLTSRINVDDCKDEALSIVKCDEILEKHNRPLRNLLLRILGSKIDGKARGDILDDKNGAQYISLNRLKFQLQTPVRQLEQHYLSYVLEELKASIDAQDKAKTEICMKALISQCISMGWSTKGLFLLSELFEGEKSELEKWTAFKNRITTDGNTFFEIYYSIKIETRPGMGAENVRDTIRAVGLRINTGSEIINGDENRRDLYSKLSAETTYIISEVSAADLYSAVLAVINTLNSKLSIATFYNTISPWIANSPQIVAYNKSSHTALALRLTDIFKTYDYIDSNNGVFEDTNRIFTNGTKEHITTKLSAAFAYTNLSRSSLFQETKYISLWIALESVMRTGQYSDIISHVKFVLPEILCIRYFYRMVRNFSEDCIRCGFKTETSIGIDMQSANKKELVKQLICIFRDSQAYQVLHTRCSANSLLDYRCSEIHELLNDPTAIIQKFEHYTQKIRWHIQRLYRIRNEITHSAFQEDKSLVIYIEHLYTYLAQLMSEVVYYVEHKNVSTVEEAYAIILESYRTYYELLKEGGLQVADVLPTGVIEIV